MIKYSSRIKRIYWDALNQCVTAQQYWNQIQYFKVGQFERFLWHLGFETIVTEYGFAYCIDFVTDSKTYITEYGKLTIGNVVDTKLYSCKRLVECSLADMKIQLAIIIANNEYLSKHFASELKEFIISEYFRRRGTSN